MKGSRLAWATHAFSNAVERWNTLNDCKCVGKKVGWIVIGFAIAYTSTILLLSATTAARVPVILACALPLVLFFLMSYASKLHISMDDASKGWISPSSLFAIVVIPYLALSIWCYSVPPDTKWQWRQVLGVEPFDDWHPVIHTALMYMAALLHKSIRAVVMVQVTVFAILITWLYSTFRKYGYNRRLSYLVVAFAVANPLSTSLLRAPWKDTAFAMSGLALTICLINILETKGAWLSGKRLLGFAVLLFFAAFLRHNGFFYALPLAVLLPFSVSKIHRRRALICLGLAIAVSLSYVVLRVFLIDVGVIGVRLQSKGTSYQGFVEAVGLPMCIMSESYVLHPEKTPRETVEFLETLCDRDFWVQNYEGDFNSVKFKCWDEGNHTGPKIASIGKKKFAEIFLATVKKNPVSAIKALISVTSIAWSPFPKTLDRALAHADDGFLAGDINAYQQIVLLSPLGTVATAPGFYLLCIILAMCYGILKSGFRICIFSLPIILYQFGTMLLLTGFDYRFFYITVLCGGGACLSMLRREQPC